MDDREGPLAKMLDPDERLGWGRFQEHEVEVA